MIALNLKADCEEYELIKQYLEENVSEALAEKINNGVKITKDNKIFINKKDLNGFWQFASKEAQKLAEKGARMKAVKDETVYGWAIHYFEEDSIEGKLFNEDGTEYKPAPKPIPTYTKPTPKPTPKPQNQQQSLFDMLEQNDKTDNEENENVEELEDDDIAEIETLEEENKIQELPKETQKVEKTEVEGTFITSPQIIQFTKKAIDKATGEILTEEEIENSFDKHTMYILSSILDGKLEIQ